MRPRRLLIVTAGLLAAAVTGCVQEDAPLAPARRPDISGTWVHPDGPGGGGLRPAGGIPLTPWAIERMKAEKPTASSDFRETTDPAVLYADPNGYPRIQQHPMKFKLVQTDDYVYHLWEYNQNWRQIAINQEHSPDAPLTWYGNAVGKWDGDTLVVDTVGINERSWLDTAGHEHSDKLHMTERFRLADANTLEHVVTYDDPVFFVKPFTTRRLFKRQVGDRILDHSCLENEKDSALLVPTIGDAGR